MSNKKIIISGTGCALADFLYNGISFDSKSFRKYLSKKTGDGGLCPGKLVFTEELEKFSGKSYREILKEIIGTRTPSAFNVGGPSLVSLIHAAQMLDSDKYEVRFFGTTANDKISREIFDIVQQTPLNTDNYISIESNTSPFTDVFSDPTYDNGHGERTFINNIGVAWEYSPDRLTNDFFNSQIVCFGGTALVPQIHDNLTSLLQKSKKNNCITLVNTVFDFRNEKNKPGEPWPLVNRTEDYALIDILLMDCEEALKISGQKTIERAAAFFTSTKVSSFIITNGVNNIFAWSGGGLFKKSDLIQLPVSHKVINDIKSNPGIKGDTTGCGDNFTGGIIASLAWQLKNKKPGQFDFNEALSWGITSGGFCCYTIGGTYLEKNPGEKRDKIRILQKDYLKQIGA
jgi:sugar/nucleoside kinase (ribokinase family)